MQLPGKLQGFILLEVLLAVVIIGVAMVTLTKGMILSIDSVERIKRNEQAILVAESLLNDMMLEPPAEGTYENDFEDDPRLEEILEGWSYRVKIEAEEPDYDEKPRAATFQELEQVYYADVRIFFKDPAAGRRGEEKLMLEFETALLEPELFTPNALQENQLF